MPKADLSAFEAAQLKRQQKLNLTHCPVYSGRDQKTPCKLYRSVLCQTKEKLLSNISRKSNDQPLQSLRALCLCVSLQYTDSEFHIERYFIDTFSEAFNVG